MNASHEPINVTLLWRKPGSAEDGIQIVNPALFAGSRWLRERRVRSIKAAVSRRRKVAAISTRAKGRRGHIRVWYIRPTDRQDKPYPVEAVMPQSIRANAQSIPYHLQAICDEIRAAIAAWKDAQ